jgi:hypothetical protein
VSEKKKSARSALATMIMYYHAALIEDKVDNSKDVILDTVMDVLKDIPSKKYSISSLNPVISPAKIIDNISMTIDNIKSSGVIDPSDIINIKQGLIALKNCIRKE